MGSVCETSGFMQELKKCEGVLRKSGELMQNDNVTCTRHSAIITDETGSQRLQTLPTVLPPVVTLSTRHFLVAIYAGTLCANIMSYIFHCLQELFLRAKPEAACEPHSFSLPATSSNLSLCAKMTLSVKSEIHNISLRLQRRTEPWQHVT